MATKSSSKSSKKAASAKKVNKSAPKKTSVKKTPTQIMKSASSDYLHSVEISMVLVMAIVALLLFLAYCIIIKAL